MRTFDPKTILRDELGELKAYSPTPGNFEVRLDANEAPPLMSAASRKLLLDTAQRTLFERYPDAAQKNLRKAIAQSMGLRANQILAGVGSDEIITLLLTVATRTDSRSPAPTLVTTTPTFVMYRLSARIRGQRVLEVPLTEDWDLSQESLLRAVEFGRPNIIFIASPNNPTGTMMSKDRLEAVIEATDESLVVIDEAYIDYAETNHLELLEKYENVAILRTLSKIGFASLRVGWIAASPALIAELDKARLPYNLPTLSQALATVALTDLSDEITANCAAVKVERARVEAGILSHRGLTVAPSAANFLWFDVNGSAADVFEKLKKEGVLVRSFHGRGGRLERCLRVSIGTHAENDRFLEALREAL